MEDTEARAEAWLRCESRKETLGFLVLKFLGHLGRCNFGPWVNLGIGFGPKSVKGYLLDCYNFIWGLWFLVYLFFIYLIFICIYMFGGF